MTNVAFSPTFAKAIEDKVVAGQAVPTPQQSLGKERIEAQKRAAVVQAYLAYFRVHGSPF